MVRIKSTPVKFASGPSRGELIFNRHDTSQVESPNTLVSTMTKPNQVVGNDDKGDEVDSLIVKFREARITIDNELKALEYLNVRQAVNEISGLYDLPQNQLWVYYTKGEEEAGRRFKLFDRWDVNTEW